MTDFIYGLLFWIPVAIIVIGLLLMLPSAKKSYTYRKSKSFRQIIGKILTYAGVIVTTFQFGANKRDWFVQTPGDRYVYKCLLFGDTIPIMDQDSTTIDSIAVTPDTLYCDTILGNGISVAMSQDSMSGTYYIPFENVNGCKLIRIGIGDINIKAYFDTGCGYKIAFCPKDYYKLVGAGIIEEDKFTDKTQSVIADGSTVDNYVFRMPECVIGNVRFRDFDAVCMTSGGETLVGSPLFEHFKSYVVDNKEKRIILNK